MASVISSQSELVRVARESQIHEGRISVLLEEVGRWKGNPIDLVERVDLGAEEMGVHVDVSKFVGGEKAIVRLAIQACIRRRGVETRLVLRSRGAGEIDACVDPALVKVVARARSWFEQVASGQFRSFAEIARAEGIGRRYVANMIPLAFLSPDIVARILEGTQPVELTAQALTKQVDLPLDWADQRAQLGFG